MKNVWGQTNCIMGDLEMAYLRNVCMQHFNDVNVTIFFSFGIFLSMC